jgi:branched-chain amino acid transport system substrate-binding protein
MKTWMNRFAQGLLSGFVAICLVLPAQAQTTPGVTDNEIVVGLFGPLSGPLVAYGVDPLNAAKMIYDDVNAKGGIHGRKIRLVIEDDKCNGNELVGVVKKLITVDNVFFLHGGSCTAAIAAAQEYVLREKVPFVMLNAAGDNAVFPPTRYMFGSFQGTQRVYGSALAEYAVRNLKAKRVAIIVHDDDYGKANLAAAKAVVERLGGQVVAQERIPPAITDITAPVLNLRASKPDAILSGAYPAPAVLLAQKYGEFGMTSIPLLQSTQGMPTPSVYAKNVGNPDALKNVYHTWSFNDIADDALRQKWVGMYRKHYPDREPGPFMVTGIPSALAVVDTLQRMGRDLTREKFVEAMEQLNLKADVMTGPLQFGPGRRDALRSVVVVKFDGKSQKVMPGVFAWNGKDGN